MAYSEIREYEFITDFELIEEYELVKTFDKIFICFHSQLRSEGIDIFAELDGKLSVIYKHCNILYYSTINIREIKGKMVLNIKLNNNGFQYERLPYSRTGIERHHSASWNKVKYVDAFFERYLRNILRFFKETFEDDFFLEFFYNENEQRADLVGCLKKKASATCYDKVCITFECGDPVRPTQSSWRNQT